MTAGHSTGYGADESLHGDAPLAWDFDAIREEAMRALADKAHPRGRFVNGRVVVVLASPAENNAKDVAVGFSAIPAGISTEEHSHPAEEIAIVISGKGTVEIGGTRRDVNAGEVIFTPSLAPHRTTATGDAPFVSLWVYSPAGSESRWLPSQGFAEPQIKEDK